MIKRFQFVGNAVSKRLFGSIRTAAGVLSVLALASAMPLLSAGEAAAQTLQVTTSDEDLKSELQQTARVLNPPAGTSAADLVSLAKSDYERLLSVLYDSGYFGPAVSITIAGQEAAGLSVLSPPVQAKPVIVRIDPGRRFVFGKASVTPMPAGTAQPEDFAPGKVASVSTIRDATTGAVDAWRQASHAIAAVAGQLITARHPEAKLDVVVTLDPGPPLRFGQLILLGESAVSERRLRQIAGLPAGAPFSPASVRRVQERLIDAGAFRAVDLREAKTANADGTLDLTLDVEDAAPRRIGFGAEVFSDEGLSLEAFWMHRNAFGGAERLRFDLEVGGIGGNSGGIDYALGATLKIPGYRRPDDALTLNARFESLNEPTFKSDIARAGVRRERRIDSRRTASLGAGLRYSKATRAFGTQNFRHIFVEARATYDGRDNKLAPRKGVYGNLKIEPFIGVAGSKSGLRLTGDARVYRAVGDRTVLAARLQMGTVAGPALQDTPPELLFLSGGGGTVRGQSFQSLGVTTGAGLSGGRSFLGLSTEVRQDLNGALGLVAFADIGFIGDGSDFTDMSSHAGFGIGACYITGLGALRVDLGMPADNPKLGDIQIYIGLGEAF